MTALPQILVGVKIQGQQANATPIATVVVNYNANGTWDYQDAAGFTHVYNGDVPEVNLLLQLAFVGAGGLPVGTKLFGEA